MGPPTGMNHCEVATNGSTASGDTSPIKSVDDINLPDNGLHAQFYQPPANLNTQELQFKRIIEKKYNVQLANYRDFHAWSCKNYDVFWEDLVHFAKIKLGGSYKQVIDKSKKISDFPKWFDNATLNYTENCLRGNDNDPAFISAHLNCETITHTYAQLRDDIERIGMALRNSGVKMGDTICGFMPNSYETAVALFASAAIGATWCSASVDFGHAGVLDRFRQVKPKILFTVEAVTYKNKRFDLTEKLNKVVEGLPSLEKIVLVNNLNSHINFDSYSHSEKFVNFDSFKVPSSEVPSPFHYEQVPFSHPLFVMFSSGTTGIPKCIVHTTGGTLLKHVEEHLIQGDSRPEDRMLFYTTCGWMMYNWLISFLYCGGSIVLYDESPLEPDPHILLKIAAKTKCTMLGMGAKLYDEFTKMNVDFKSLYDLSNLRTVYSTGSPLKAASFEFINDHIQPKVLIASISGGTDIIGCFMGGSFSLPVVPGECQCLFLGMDVKAFDSNGRPIEDEQGELVCLTPFPSMPSHFLGDENHKKYKKAYFERFDGIWAHGDYCQISSVTGGVVMLGRSDATLNRGGVRIGTAEIYSVVDTFSEISDCIVAGQNRYEKATL
ncbi:hypothetical protein WR25_04776 isoform B [Diploscapter pachys]|uniref:Acetoacetyl-CoA synthetase n=1 Tax=Diploscapter pachys TaxID=2018661 RepID=A0A2A2L443_9BILA|nr:hypothetical protein WR25_04776 isoform B [Diploscapter pachys]